MANLNQNLKDYLSKSQAKEPLLGLEKDSSESFNLGRFNPFRKSPPENDNTNDVANSWFSQAQNDPICPGLVSVVFFAFEDIYRKKGLRSCNSLQKLFYISIDTRQPKKFGIFGGVVQILRPARQSWH